MGTALWLYGDAKPFVGVITDTMCGVKHSMGNLPPDKCTIECVKSNPARWKYALASGNDVYVLSDQKRPEQFAGKKVRVTGTLDARTRTIDVRKIEPAE